METQRKKHRTILRDNIQGLTKPAIQRLSYRGGVLRLDHRCYDEVRAVIKVEMEDILHDASVFMQHRKAHTLKAKDVIAALENRGIKLAYSTEREKGKNKQIKVKKC